MSQVSKKTSSGDLPTLVQTVTTQDGIATAAANNLNFNGYPQVVGSPQIGMTHALGDTFTYEDRSWLTSFVVDPSTTVGSRGTYSTIAAALTDATSGTTIFIRPGTYTEDLTLKAGVNIQAFPASGINESTIILGNATASFAGMCTISGIELKTNSNPFLTVSGSSATVVNLLYCYLNCNNNTGISFTSSSASARLNIFGGFIFHGSATSTLFSASSAGRMTIDGVNGGLVGSSGVTTASSSSATYIDANNTKFNCPFSTSSTGILDFTFCEVSCNNQNATCITTSGTTGNSFENCNFSSGTATAISIGASTTCTVLSSLVKSTNANAIGGSGTLIQSAIDFGDSSSTIQSTLTVTQRYSTCFQYLATQTFTSNGTYTPTTGMKYCLVEVWGGGGGGAGCPASGATTVSSGGGGGGGGYGKGIFTANQIGASQAVTIGTGGAGGVGNAAGGAGNTSSLGALISAGGGSGGANAGAGAIVAVSGGPGGSGGSGGYYHIDGGDGGAAFSVYNAAGSGTSGGQGGSSGAGGGGGAQSAGGSATSNNGSAGAKGGGGSGACNTESQPARNGGAGGDGYMAITEFC